MGINQEKGNIASLIISIIILIIVIILVIIICCSINTNTLIVKNNNIKKTQAVAMGAYLYKNKFESCGFMKFGSVQCCGKPDGTYCTHNQKHGQCFAGTCDITCGGGTSKCQCWHNGAECTMNQVLGQCYEGKCKPTVNCTQPVTELGACQTMQCLSGKTWDICARFPSNASIAGYCTTNPTCIMIANKMYDLMDEEAGIEEKDDPEYNED